MPKALITGAARGIGAATARALADGGWDLVLFDHCADNAALSYSLATEADLHAVANTTGGTAVIGDVRSLADLRNAVDTAGTLDAAIGVAGVLSGGAPLWEITDEAFDTQIDVNLRGVANLARAAVPAILDRPAPRSGRFVATGSAIALKATPRLAAYAASKAGVVGLVRSLAADLGNTGVTANVVEPGTTNTSLLAPSQAVYELSDPSELVEQHIHQRVLDPSEIAATIAWLCSPAAQSITGAVIPVDGGFSAR